MAVVIAPSSPTRGTARGSVTTRGCEASGVSSSCPPKCLSRLLCCAGAVVLLQNVLLLRYGYYALKGCAAPPADLPAFAGWSDGIDQGALVPASTQIGINVVPARAAPLQAEVTELPRETATKRSRRKRKARAERANARPPSREIQNPARTPQHDPEAASPMFLTGPSDVTSQQLQHDSSLLSVPRERLRLFGNPVPSTVKICVGFGSVKRKKDYVLATLGSMLGLTGSTPTITPSERDMVVVVAHLADFDLDWVRQVTNQLKLGYSDLVAKGQFHLLHAPQEFYPNLEVCPPYCSYNDEPKRVKWRSKQNVDYAFLLYYAAPLAPYYLQIEDDLGFARNWIAKISDYITGPFGPTYRGKAREPWRLIDFSQLGFIGKMFQSDEVTRMAQFLLLFYDQMPCDLLLSEFMMSMNQRKRIDYWKKNPSLFQHVGVFRSLGGFQPLQERKFGRLVFDNPQGSVKWSMQIVPTYEGKFAYWPGGEPNTHNDICDYNMSVAHKKQKRHKCWFWARNAKAGSDLTIVFSVPGGIPFKAAFVEFGHPKHPKDLLQHGALQVAPLADGRGGTCGTFSNLADIEGESMVYWEEGVSDPATLPMPTVQCLRIVVLRDQEGWLAVTQVQVRSIDL